MSSFTQFLNKVLSRNGFLILGLAALLALAPAVADARMGNGSSSGSRGSKTFSAPPATSTAPHSTAPMERSMTQQPTHAPSYSQAQAPARSGMFGGLFGGFGGGLLAGLLGAGLFGMLFGHGLTGGLGGIGSILGLVLQLALLFFVVRFAMSWFANRNRPAMAGVNERSAFDGGGPGPQGGGFGGGAPQYQAPVTTPIQLQDADFSSFERLLGESQSAYSDENIDRLRALATPEMVAYFSQEIAEHARKGVINKISGVKLLQGDLSEAWRENNEEYATVAMRFSLIDVMQDRASGRIVSGNPSAPEQAVEVWTFVRPAGYGPQEWKLSAIQQAS